ncbi:MAG: RDD family protein [Thermodesulfobacteriota bacterium]
MKCPYCGYNSFDHLERCKKCGSALSGDPEEGAAPEEKTSGDRASSHPRPKGDSAESIGELFGHGELLAEGAASARKYYRSRVSGRKRISRVKNPPEDEYIELFPVSKDVGRETPSKRARDDFPHSDQIKERHSDDEVQDLRPEDPVMFGEHEYAPPEKVPEEYTDFEEPDVYNLAGFFSRSVAMIIDILLVSLIAFLAATSGLYLVNGFTLEGFGSEDIFVPMYVVLFFLASTYFVFLHGYGGKTVGKILMGIKLINNEGERIGFWSAFVRWLGYYVSSAFLFAGFLWSLADSECQTWHDKLAGTYVVKD